MFPTIAPLPSDFLSSLLAQPSGPTSSLEPSSTPFANPSGAPVASSSATPPAGSASAPALSVAPATSGVAATPVLVTAHPKPPPSTSFKPGQTPGSTPVNLGPILTAKVEVIHLGDKPISVTVSFLDTGSGQTSEITTLTLQTLDSDSEPVFAGDYVVTFRRASDPKAATCTLHVQDGDGFRFVTTDRTTAVFRDGGTPKTGADVLIASSPLCKPKG